ncbi:MAG: tRNA pseudouridine(38-40) synthase TruA [Candidatus Binatia bacterium]
MRFRATVEYDGTDFAGWQLQPDAVTIQGTLEKALGTILGHPVRVEAAGRTDAGVHARGQVVAFETVRPVDARKLLKSWNALAGPAIAIRDLAEMTAGFDPRRDAQRRTYEYRIQGAPFASPFTRRFAWHVHETLDLEAMGGAAATLVGEHDFSSFQAADCDAENPVREIYVSRVDRSGETIVYTVTATAFLRHMVRAIVGTLVEVGRGDRPVADLERILAARDRTKAGPTAPPHGLCLLAIDYDR